MIAQRTPDPISPETWLAMAQALGVHAQPIRDPFGRLIDVRLAPKAVRAFHRAALQHGFGDIADILATALTDAQNP